MDIIKVCRKHGQLTLNDVNKHGKLKDGSLSFKCKKCMKELHAQHYQTNRDKVLKKNKHYRQANPERVAQTKHNSWVKHKERNLQRDNLRRLLFKQNNPEKYRERDLRRVHDLETSYVAKLIMNRSNIVRADISDDLIECVRALTLFKRLLKSKFKQQKAEEDVHV